MQKYIGTKQIEARPMTRGDYNNYKGWDRMLTDLKTQFPAQFTASSGSDDGKSNIIENRLPDGNQGNTNA